MWRHLVAKFATNVSGAGVEPGVELRFWFKQGKEKRLPARILAKARKCLSRQNSIKKCVNVKKQGLNSTKKYVNLWENA